MDKPCIKYNARMHIETDLEVTWIHQWKKNGKRSTRTRPFLVNAVQGLSGLALLNVDPKIKTNVNKKTNKTQ